MFVQHFDASVGFMGRFAPLGDAMVTTAPGSSFKIAFCGKSIVLHFDIADCVAPYPHIWVQIDGGMRAETQVDRWIRFEVPTDGKHVCTVVYKGGNEQHNRWSAPLQGKVAFLGYDADATAKLSEDNRKSIEFLGDSITEGVLVDYLRYHPRSQDQDNRIYQDDATATYAWLTAEALNLKHYHLGFGATGLTRSGNGGAPKCGDAYPYCFEGAPVTYDHPDYVMINHGANDRKHTEEEYITEYRALIAQIRKAHPDAKIICLSAFCVAFPKAIAAMVEDINKTTDDDIFFIDSAGWVPAVPLHPTRNMHATIAENLIPLLKERYGL